MLSPAATAVAAVRATAGSPAAVRGMHARILKEGLAHHPPNPAALVSAYAKSRLLPDALHLFDETPRRDIYIYSSLLTAVSHSASPEPRAADPPLHALRRRPPPRPLRDQLRCQRLRQAP
ncbi:hypothetical protein OsJ_34733 [Oryza sativa Japonica Group]|uniref:Pentatricopeptide repeat-containing protein n=1 Tax=Oryza sativa subsp. japonica TaxID=39947 RepID=B9G8Q6_ORYSJ|nr:hypothetical protein OsJ_34733 [Oryza sativa Japonica Group]